MSGVVWFLARTGAARRARAGVVMVLLLGLSGTAVLAAWAGSRRTDTAFERLRRATAHADLIVAAEGDPSSFDPTIALDGPGVRSAGIAEGYPMFELLPDGTPNLTTDTALIAPVGDATFQTISRPILREGRAPDPTDPSEILVPEDMAEAGYPLGRELDVCLFDLPAAFAFGNGAVAAGTATHEQLLAFVDEVCEVRRLVVVGVSRRGPDEVVLREDNEADPFPVASVAFAGATTTPNLFSFVVVDLEPDADPAAYIDDLLDRAPPEAGVSTQASDVRVVVVERTLEPYVRALALFAVLAALAALAVLGPALSRWAGTSREDLAAVQALGIRPSQVRAASALRGSALGAMAAVVVVVAAWTASSRFPIGIAADIEPSHGRRADALVLSAGAIVLVLGGALLGALAPARERRVTRRPSRFAALVQGLGVGPGPTAGVRAAGTDAGGGAGVLRTIGGVAVAVAAIVASLTYQAGLSRMLDTPARYGWTWDAVFDGADEGIDAKLVAALAEDEHVEGVSVVRRMTMQQAGRELHAFAFERIAGDIDPLVVGGRAPTGDDEIAVGGQALDRLGAALGSRIEVSGPSGARAELRVVGRTLVPLGVLGSELSVGEGAVVDLPVLERLGGADPGLVLMDLAEQTSLATAEAIVEAHLDPGIGGGGLQGPTHSADLRGYEAVRRTPSLLAGLLAVLGVGVLGHTVATSVRRRRRELAMLRVVGFSSRQLRSSVRWDVLTLVGTCVLVAVPIGVAAGRILWVRFARSIGVADDARTPLVAVALVAVVTVLVALVFTLVPGRQATRLRPASVLRAE